MTIIIPSNNIKEIKEIKEIMSLRVGLIGKIALGLLGMLIYHQSRTIAHKTGHYVTRALEEGRKEVEIMMKTSATNEDKGKMAEGAEENMISLTKEENGVQDKNVNRKIKEDMIFKQEIYHYKKTLTLPKSCQPETLPNSPSDCSSPVVPNLFHMVWLYGDKHDLANKGREWCAG